MIPFKPVGYKRLLNISDVHLYNRSTAVEHVMDTLDKHVFNTARLLDVDVVTVSGDLFDRSVKLVMGGLFYDWITHVLELLKETNTALRILEGTPSHDWKQSQLIVDINKSSKINADVIYVSELSIIDDPIMGTVAYVPDECRSDPNKILTDLQEMMATRGISQVDFTIAHGFFDFQLPPNHTVGMDSLEFSKITKHLVICGHDHRRKRNHKVLVPGSWDRYAHGEEGPKGGVVADWNDEECIDYFLPNPDAYPYVKFSYLELTDEEILRRIDEDLNSAPIGYVRFELKKDTTLVEYFNELKRKERVEIDVVYKSDAVDALEKTILTLEYHTVNIEESNITEIIIDELAQNETYDRELLLSEIEAIKAAL